MPQAPYIAATVPARIVVADGMTNLFRIAAREVGDALLAWQLADLNGLPDFWPDAGTQIAIPQAAADPDDGVRPH